VVIGNCTESNHPIGAQSYTQSMSTMVILEPLDLHAHHRKHLPEAGISSSYVSVNMMLCNARVCNNACTGLDILMLSDLAHMVAWLATEEGDTLAETTEKRCNPASNVQFPPSM